MNRSRTNRYLKVVAGLALGVGLALPASGCALLRKGEPLHVRYFVPELDTPLSTAEKADAAPVEPLRLRLGRVTGGAELGQRIVLRRTGGEISFYEDLRWTERPEHFLRRDLAHALFEVGGLKRIVSGPGNTLDVELVAFEEVRGARHEARFRAVIVLYSDREQLLERTVSASVEIRGDGPGALVEALSGALAEGVAGIASASRAALTPVPVAANPG